MDLTLVKGLAVLEWLVRQQSPARVIDVAKAFGLARSNAHRTLQTLVECGWVVQDPVSSCYRPSLRMFELGALVGDATDVRALMRPKLAALARASGETIHLATLDGADIVYLDKFDSPLPVAAYSRIGGRAPAYCVASGKALLAAAHPDATALGVLFPSLAAHTPNSITQIDALLAELELIRKRGYAENREEWRMGVCGLGAPLFDARGAPVAAIGMSIPAIRFTRAKSRTFAEQLLACVREAAAVLGSAGSPGPSSGADAQRLNVSPLPSSSSRRHA